MSSRKGRDQKRDGGFHEKLQQLASVVNSTAEKSESIIEDASRYIEELKERVEKKHEDGEEEEDYRENATTSSSHEQQPMVNVEEVVRRKGSYFLINVVSENKGQGLLLSILQGLEELGLEVKDANVSCSHSFSLQASLITPHHHQKGGDEEVDAKLVQEVVLQAIANWTTTPPHNHS